MENVKKYWFNLNGFLDDLFENKRAVQIVFLLVIAINIYFKFFFLAKMHVKFDDAFSIFYSQQSLTELYAKLSKEANPPFYFTLLHFWIKLFGVGVVAVKSLSAIFSVGSAAVIFMIAKRYMNLLGVLVVSILFVFSNLHFDFSHEVRAFSLVFFLSSLSIYLFLRVIDDLKVKWLVALCLVNALLPYSHYTSVLLPFTEFLIALFVLIKKKKDFFKLSLCFFSSAILFIPQLLTFSNSVPDATFWLKKPTKIDLEYVFIKLIGHDPSYSLIYNLLLFGLVLVLVNLFLPIFKKSFDYRKLLLFIAIYFLPIFINYAIAQYTPVFRLRYMLFSGIGPLLALGYMLSKIKIPSAFLLAFSIHLTLPFIRSFKAENQNVFRWDKVAQVVKDKYQKEYYYYIVPAWRVNDFTYYFDREAFRNYKERDRLLEGRQIKALYSSGQMLKSHNKENVILILCNPQDSDSNQTIQKELILRGYSLSESWFESEEINVEVWKFKS